MNYRLLIFSVLLLGLSAATGPALTLPGTDKITEEDAAASAMPEGTDEVTLPLKSAGRLYLVEAVIDGVSGNLIFDTGATGLVLNKTYFRNHLTSAPVEAKGITGNTAITEKVVAGALNISGLKFTKIPATVSDLSHIENRRGIKVLGLFGFELIRNFEIEINYNLNELILKRISRTGELVGGHGSFTSHDITVPVEEKNNILFISAKIGGKMLRFCLDTGAETNALDKNLPKSVMETIVVERRSNLTGAGSGRAEVLLGKLKEMNIGESQFRNMPVIITGLESLSEAYGVKTEGMLGYDFLMKGILCVNFAKGELKMKLNREEKR